MVLISKTPGLQDSSRESPLFNIYVYNDAGVFPESLEETLYTLKLLSDMPVKTIGAKEIINSDWDQRASLLVFPGGADRFYCKALNGKGNQRIREFVESGGGFLGICGGSYYGGAYVDFARGTEIEVLGKRELAFFQGVVKGPTLAPYNYFIREGARAATIKTQEGELYTAYYNGGGSFIDADQKNVIAYYDNGEPAIVLYQVGCGHALLSGVHFEYESSRMNREDPYIEKIFDQIAEGDERRREFARELILRICRKLP